LVLSARPQAPTPSRASTPSTAKITAAMRCTTRIGTRLVIASPKNTTGALASIMPSVVPATTATSGWY